MPCIVCSKEGKTVSCRIDATVCAKCCFSISSGDPNFLKAIKEIKKLMKDEVLAFCNGCSNYSK
ncbi:MAG: hypothetical protein ABII27_07585 [bacterium]